VRLLRQYAVEPISVRIGVRDQNVFAGTVGVHGDKGRGEFDGNDNGRVRLLLRVPKVIIAASIARMKKSVERFRKDENVIGAPAPLPIFGRQSKGILPTTVILSVQNVENGLAVGGKVIVGLSIGTHVMFRTGQVRHVKERGLVGVRRAQTRVGMRQQCAHEQFRRVLDIGTVNVVVRLGVAAGAGVHGQPRPRHVTSRTATSLG
jgi:hypothetical protein